MSHVSDFPAVAHSAPAHDNGLRFVQPEVSAGLPLRLTVKQLTTFFVGLGITVRLIRYLAGFPLWADEYQLSANLLDRGFLELLQPLGHNQVAPVGFLWVEHAMTRLFGFSEWSLRLFPAVCGVASVLLFRKVAGRLLSGVPLLLAVAIFAVAYYPIRHSAEIKPYASDAFLSLLLFWLTVNWWRSPDQTRWLLWLAAAAPLALALSFPAAFVAGGLSLGIASTLWQRRRLGESHKAAWAWVVFNLAVALAFFGLLQLNIAAQYAVTQHDMVACWDDGFPPWRQPLRLFAWLAIVHTSEMFSYPVGAENGGSFVTFVCFAVALAVMFRRPRREVALTVVGWFGLSLIAAAMHRYPYGAHARLSQYLAPAICLLAGSGAALLLAQLRRREWQAVGVRLVLLGCVLLGAGTLVRNIAKPYHDLADRDHRDFARRLWAETPDELTVCLQTDLGLRAYDRSFETAYLCHHRIYAPAKRREGPSIGEQIAAADRQLRCVVVHSVSAQRNETVFEGWMLEMLSRYDLVQTETQRMPLTAKNHALYDFYVMQYDVYHFHPKASGGSVDQLAGAQATVPAR